MKNELSKQDKFIIESKLMSLFTVMAYKAKAQDAVMFQPFLEQKVANLFDKPYYLQKHMRGLVNGRDTDFLMIQIANENTPYIFITSSSAIAAIGFNFQTGRFRLIGSWLGNRITDLGDYKDVFIHL